MKYDFVGVGDMVTDAFIELEDAWIENDNPEKKKELCMRFGDKIPYRQAVVVPAVGNAINAAVSASRLGLNSAVVSNVGHDLNGKECMSALKKEGVSSRFISVHPDKPSNYNYVLRYKEERTILVHHNEYNYVFPKNLPPPKFIYLSSLAKNSLSYHAEIIKYLREHPETKLAFQPGTFQIKQGIENLRDLYQLTEIFFCNREEAEKILAMPSHSEMKNLLIELNKIGPKICVITDGPNGAYVYDNYSTKTYFTPMYPDPKPPVDRTGAGDSFSSAFVALLILGKSVPEALQMAPINSMSVVQQIGAREGLLNLKQMQEWLLKAPADYQVKEI